MELSPKKRDELVDLAIRARERSYSPYSHYAVGAALLAASGKIYTGVNIENSAYPTSICAERVAIFKAISEGERNFEAIAIATENGGSPCGSCRQVMSEFSLQMKVIVVDDTGNIHIDASVDDLLPHAFTPEDLI
ncbi:MAG TPA: cytidine deaminase [Anaerolineaceae bacterium]|jgi:cytidine deaminase|nr:cytidine deaminase [Anaerolineaceae bacterium]